jgi:hypothetical protein
MPVNHWVEMVVKYTENIYNTKKSQMAGYFFSNNTSRGKAVLPAGYSAARHKNHNS